MSVQPKGTRRTVADLGDTGSSGEKPARNLPRLARGFNPDDAGAQAEVVDVGCPGGERFQRVPVSACTAATSQRSRRGSPAELEIHERARWRSRRHSTPASPELGRAARSWRAASGTMPDS